jgi:hypoxanthine-DNA glycosylase
METTIAAPLLSSLPAIADVNARVLILGSMPGPQSLANQAYYAHKGNKFWEFMAKVLGIDDLKSRPYDQRKQALVAARIAVWDVLKHCERSGALDANIVVASEIPNDFPAFFAAHPQLRAVFLNGGKAASAFDRYVQPGLATVHPQIAVTTLPSTSPANAGQSKEWKEAQWMRVAAALSLDPVPADT